MIKAVIIDDEPAAVRNLQIMLRDYAGDVDVLGVAHSVDSGIRITTELKPDLVFLDVEMADGTGFDILEAFQPNTPFQVVFTTAFSDFAIEALRERAIDYLVKPYSVKELRKAISRVLLQKQNISKPVSNSPELNVAFPTTTGMKLVPTSDIIAMKSSRSYTEVDFTWGRMTVSKPLRHFSSLLNDTPGFIRINRFYLVNTAHIKEISRADGGHLEMTNKVIVHVGAKEREKLQQILRQEGNLLA